MADKTQREVYLELALRTIQTELLEAYSQLVPFVWKLTGERHFDVGDRNDFGSALKCINESLSVIENSVRGRSVRTSRGGIDE